MALAGWESGRRTPPGEVLLGLLDALGASPREKALLLTLADPRHALIALAHTDEGPPVGLGEVLRAMGLRLGLTQAELAGHIGSAQSTVARWERGDQDLAPSMRHILMEILDATPDERDAVGAVDPGHPSDADFEERYERIIRAPHELGEVLWLVSRPISGGERPGPSATKGCVRRSWPTGWTGTPNRCAARSDVA